MKLLNAFRGRPIAQQMVVLMFIALAIVTAVNIAIVALQPPPPRQAKELTQVVGDLRRMTPQLATATPAQRRTLLERASGRSMQYSISKDAGPAGRTPLSRAMAARTAELLGVPAENVHARSSFGRNNFVGQLAEGAPPAALDAMPFFGGAHVAVKINDSEWLVAAASNKPQDWGWLRFIGLSFVGCMLLLTPIALLFANRLAAPIGRFAQAAEQLGRDPNSPPMPAEGPKEVRTAVSAFNTMQERLRKFVAGRTLMLATISHDLRTPLQRLRFRIDALPDKEREAMLADIEEMETMIAASLSFATDDAAPTQRESLDLGALVSSVCDDAADSGGETQFAAEERIVVRADPVRLKRALSNLVSNAVKYAGGAEVRVLRQPGSAVVEVADRGPGIPVDRMEEMFQPFRRMEPSRNRSTGGSGLGLAIARTIARAHGGDVTLTERPGGGLTARLALPA